MRSALISLLMFSLLPTTVWAVFGDEDFDTSSSVIKDIVLEGNTRTHDDLIIHEMGVRIGQELSRSAMNDVLIHLEDIGWFAFVDMEFDDSEDDGVILRVYLEEDLTMAYGPLLSYDRRQKYQLGAWIQENHWRGRGEKLRLEIGALYARHAGLSFSHPWLFGQKGLRLELSMKGEISNFVYRPTNQKWFRAQGLVHWDHAHGLFTEAGASFKALELEDPFIWNSPGSRSHTMHGKDTTNLVSTYLAAGLDTRDNPFYPSYGHFLRLEGRRWSGPDFQSYNQGDADLRFFIPLPLRDHVLALRAWGRQVSAAVPLDNTLFFGGPETIRGYRFAGLEGDEGYLLSAEYRIPLAIVRTSASGKSMGLGLHVFADAGDAWFAEGDPGRAIQSWGGGAHLILNTMQLRFEAAKTQHGDRVFEFSDHFNF